MRARLGKCLSYLAEAFWLVPSSMTLLGILLAIGLVHVDAADLLPTWLLENAFLYTGGGTGARTLLGAVASSTIGVAGTVFSITIAALSLAAGQMGPRLLRNFTKDRGNQIALGTFLGTFSYALMVLRTVRTGDEGVFVPYLSLTFSILLAFVCVGTLIYFVGHMASRINVDTVIALVSDDLREATARLALKEIQPEPPAVEIWHDAVPVVDQRRGYLQHLDGVGLARWARDNNAMVHLLVRPGDYVFPGVPIALVKPPTDGCSDAIRRSTALGDQRNSAADIEFSIRQLVEVAVRALSPGINDPHTAINVLDRFGTALCDLAPLHLPTGLILIDEYPAIVTPRVTYDGLIDAMFHMIRQNAAHSTAVLIRLLDVLTASISCERDDDRIRGLQRHADLVMSDAERNITTPADLQDVRRRHKEFMIMKELGPYHRLIAQNPAVV